MGRFRNTIVIITILIVGINCKTPYEPSIIASNGNYLVVEGVINTAQDSTVIKLSRTVNLSGKTNSNPELNAIVAVEDNQSSSYPLQEIGNGKYASPSLNLDNTRQYRLRIITSSGKTYLSDLEAVRSNPPIDSVGYLIQSSGMQLYINTHNPNNNTRYYRWDYSETWRFHAEYQSQYITDGTEIVLRTPDQQIYYCFANNNSSTILLGSSAKLQQDVIYQNPITQIPSTSEKIELKYSILVKQYALSTDEYNFWVNLKKNTEQLGSIFDPQPSNINGNVHCTTNPSEIVIGYVGVTSIQQKRIFISSEQLPITWVPAYPYECQQDSNLYCKLVDGKCVNQVQNNLIPVNSSEFITSAIYKPSPLIVGYLGTTQSCADCTIRGATKQPDFWR